MKLKTIAKNPKHLLSLLQKHTFELPELIVIIPHVTFLGAPLRNKLKGHASKTMNLKEQPLIRFP